MAIEIKIIQISQCPCCGNAIKAEVIAGQFEPLHVACENPICEGKLNVTVDPRRQVYNFKQTVRIYAC